MPTLGTGTFVPGGRFSFPRSYITDIVVNVDADDVALTDNVITFSDPLDTAVNFVAVIYENFIAWNSNKYTLDHIIIESYYYVLPDPTQIPMPFVLNAFNFEPQFLSLVFQPFGINFTAYHSFTLPPAPSDYWRPFPPV